MHKELLHKNLIVCLLALASDKQSQIDYTKPGCAVCDLTEDFDNYGIRCYNKEDYSFDQNKLIDELSEHIDKFIESGYACFDNNALDDLLWNEIRAKASEAITAFGYAVIPLPNNFETRIGVWSTDVSKYELKKIGN